MKHTEEELAAAILENGLRKALSDLKVKPQEMFAKMQKQSFLELFLFDEYQQICNALEQSHEGLPELLAGILAITKDKTVNPATRLQAGQTYLSFVGNLEKRKTAIENCFSQEARNRDFFGSNPLAKE